MSTVDSVSFFDVAAGNAELREELDLSWKSVLAHGKFVGGPEVEQFESDFAAYCGSRTCVGVGNGTDALELILLALDIGPGDEIIVPANTFVATVEAVCAVGARPRFVDVEPDTLLIDVRAAESAVNARTAAVIGVHLFGQMVDVPALTAMADRAGIAFVEDAAQAHGARFGARRAGSVGVAAAFSFYPGKNLGALGDGGAVVTADAALARRVRSLSNHGRGDTDRSRHELRGRNSRLDTLHAAVLAHKLSTLDEMNARRCAVARRYGAWLPESVRLLRTRPGVQHVHHLAVVRVADRDRATAALTSARIGWGVHYPVPCHRQPAYERFAEPMPVAESAAGEILSLPMSPLLSDHEVARVCGVLRGVQP